MAAEFDDAAAVHDRDAVGLPDGVEAVHDRDHRTALDQRREGPLDAA
ncbi:hypothetical protein ACFVY9_32270 [Streptomyces sp. NPDC059544]